MFSLNKKPGRRAALVLMLAVVPLVGCDIAKPIPDPEPLNATPIKVDNAMAARRWDTTSAQYKNDQTTAGPTLFTLSSKPQDWPINAFGDPGLFVANIVLIPYAMYQTPPWKDVAYKSIVVNPTYTANPPLPASPVPPVKN